MPLTATHWGLWPARTPCWPRVGPQALNCFHAALAACLAEREESCAPGPAPQPYQGLPPAPTLDPRLAGRGGNEPHFLTQMGGRERWGSTLCPLLPSLSAPAGSQADNSESQGPSVASEQTLSQFLGLIPKPALCSPQFNASWRIATPSLPPLPPLLAPSPGSGPVPLPWLQILHISMSIFSQPLSSEMGPPPSASHPSSCWIKTGLEQLFSPIIYLKALHCISYRAISAPGCLGTAAHDTYQTVTSTFAVHLIIFKMQLICLYSLTVCHTERRGTSKKDEENIFLRIIHLFYFFFSVLVGEYWRPVFLEHRTHEITESCWFVLSTSARKPPVQQDPPELPLHTPINIYFWRNSAEKGTNPASDRIYDAHGSSPWGGSGQSSPTVRPGFPLCSSLLGHGLQPLLQDVELGWTKPACPTAWNPAARWVSPPLHSMVSVFVPWGTRKHLAARRDEYAWRRCFTDFCAQYLACDCLHNRGLVPTAEGIIFSLKFPNR